MFTYIGKSNLKQENRNLQKELKKAQQFQVEEFARRVEEAKQGVVEEQQKTV